MTTKKCFKCNEEKDISCFSKHPQMKDGRLGKCKECTKKDVAKNCAEKREYYAKYERLRYQDPKRRAMAIIYQRRRREKNILQYHANYKTSNAIRDGKLKKRPCEICGAIDTQAHHDDYSKPLDVRWLCRKHHLELHNKAAY